MLPVLPMYMGVILKYILYKDGGSIVLPMYMGVIPDIHLIWIPG